MFLKSFKIELSLASIQLFHIKLSVITTFVPFQFKSSTCGRVKTIKRRTKNLRQVNCERQHLISIIQRGTIESVNGRNGPLHALLFACVLLSTPVTYTLMLQNNENGTERPLVRPIQRNESTNSYEKY